MNEHTRAGKITERCDDALDMGSVGQSGSLNEAIEPAAPGRLPDSPQTEEHGKKQRTMANFLQGDTIITGYFDSNLVFHPVPMQLPIPGDRGL